MQRVRVGEHDGLRRPLGTAPEKGAVTHAVFEGERVQKLRYGIMEFVLELQHCKLRAHLERPSPLLKHPLDAIQPGQLGRARTLRGNLREVRRRIREEGVHLSGALYKELLEEIPSPFNRVLDGVWEVLQRTQWNGLLGWVLRVAVGLGLVWQHHLDVGLRAQCARLQKWFAKPHAAGIHVHSRLKVIQSVDCTIQGIPENIIKRVLGVVADTDLQGVHLECLIHGHGCLGCRQRFRLANVCLPEEELAVEVGNLNPVHVCDGELTLWPAASTHHSKALQELTPESAGPHKEKLHIAKCLLIGLPKDGNLVSVATVGWCTIAGILRWDQLKHVNVQALVKRGVLAGELHHFLCNHTAQEGCHGTDRAP
mmetsp:Transcript_75622/g.175330  ORF Transcript_75622/g.175330 Transcript_75622/m.175330 type:complete len:368 (+) Transcript_75622:1073-2176(+)